MSIEMKNELVNLPSLQAKMDTAVFDHIDTKPDWSKAYELLDGMLQKVAFKFNRYVENNNGELPTSTTYWTLHMDIVAKLVYFTGLAHAHLIEEQDTDARAHIAKLYEISASCLPNALIEENEEFISEVKKSIAQLTGQPQHELTLSAHFAECVEEFYSLTKTYK